VAGNRYVQALDLSPGFGDFGIYPNGIANVGVGCELDYRKDFLGWWTQKTIRMVTDTF